mgnify:CR=1 FL=1|tara:strand:+ start:141 stop:527 length:387 start_codon:yes stop_codon:yes gene_type:complete
MARKKSTKSKSKKLQDLNVADGKEQDVKKIQELEALMGIPRNNLFGTTTASVLQGKMDEMNMSDLQTFAVKVGLFPSGSRLTLKNKILKEFYSTPGAGAGVDMGFQKPIVDPKSPKGKKLIALMNEGF